MIAHDDPRLTAYALNELPEDERRAFEIELAGDEAAQREVGEIAAAAALLAGEIATRAPEELHPAQRTLLEEIGEGAKAPPAPPAPEPKVVPLRRSRAAGFLALAATLAVAAGALLFVTQGSHKSSESAALEGEEGAPASRMGDEPKRASKSRYGVAASAAVAQATAAPMARADELAPDVPQAGPIKNPSALPENPFVATARETKSTF